ncbi:MAG TPA: hypothetical protein VL404_01965 [Candidatus Eisenbacteria bacterium]|nr:hypothetical protein [Candidatus Eisenbacteria bacterium]
MIKNKMEPAAAGFVILGAVGGFFAAIFFQGFRPPVMLLVLAAIAGVSTAGQGVTQMRHAKARRERFNEAIPHVERDARLKFGFGASFALFSALGILASIGRAARLSGHAAQSSGGHTGRGTGVDWGAHHAGAVRPESVGLTVLLLGVVSGVSMIFLGLQKARKPETLKLGYVFAASGILDVILCALVYRFLS